MSSVFALSADDKDQLRELINIGVSHAGTVLSRMVNRQVTISIPKIRTQSADTITQFVEQSDAISVVVLLRLSGGIEGYSFLLFPYDSARYLLLSLSGKIVGDLRALNHFDRSMFQEVGNVITGGMLQGLSQFLHLHLMHSVPDVVVDMEGAIMNSFAASMIAHHEEFLSLDVAVFVDTTDDETMHEAGKQAMGKMFLFVGPYATTQILKAMKDIVGDFKVL